MRATRLRPSPAMVVACLALLVALGGTSLATVSAVLPKNSVGTPQLKKGAVGTAKLKNGAVTSAKVKNGSLLAVDFKPGQLPGGSAGAQGPQGPPGPQGEKGPKGDAGAPGLSGAQYVMNATSNAWSSQKIVDAVCPAGKKVVGGGFTTDGTGEKYAKVTYSAPWQDLTYWRVIARWQDGVFPQGWQLVAYAVCASVTP
ncbi:MAG: hypothetical protein OEW65_07840 [Thermoleophilia bacterium]|nr:hypothetical protein [Thermoleophilia bacterium]